MQFGTRRHLTTYGHLQTVVHEALGKLERIVGMAGTLGIDGIVHTKRKVNGTQGIARNLVDLGVKERAEGGVHREGIGIAAVQIHTRSKHGDGQLASLFNTHRLQFAVQLHILWGIQRELKSHIVKRLGNHDTTIEVDAPSYSITARNGSLGAFHSSNVQRGVHRITRKLNIRTILDSKRLQRNDGQRVFHLTVRQRITSRQLQIVSRRIAHTQRTTSHQIDVIGVVSIEVGHHMGTLRHLKGHIHCESVECWTLNDNLRSIAEVSKLDQIVQLIVCSQGRVAQHIAHISSSQHFHTTSHIQIVQRATHGGKHIDEGLSIGYALGILLGVDNLEITGSHPHVDHHLIEIGEVDLALDVQRVLIIRIQGEVL